MLRIHESGAERLGSMWFDCRIDAHASLKRSCRSSHAAQHALKAKSDATYRILNKLNLSNIADNASKPYLFSLKLHYIQISSIFIQTYFSQIENYSNL